MIKGVTEWPCLRGASARGTYDGQLQMVHNQTILDGPLLATDAQTISGSCTQWSGDHPWEQKLCRAPGAPILGGPSMAWVSHGQTAIL